MNIKEIIAKVAAKQPLTDEELETLKAYDFDKALNTAAAEARRKAEARAKEAENELAKLRDELDEARSTTEKDTTEKDRQMAKLQKMVEKLTADAEAAKAENARMVRSKTLSEFAKAQGLIPADGVAESGFSILLETAFKEVDISDETAMGEAAETFKAQYAGIVKAGGARVPFTGNPVKQSQIPNVNPFAKSTFNLTEVMRLRATNPELATQLEQRAATEPK